LWTVSGRPVGLPLLHRGPVGTVAFSPNDETIMTDTRGYEAVRSVWDVFTGKPLGHPIPHREGLFARAYYGVDGKSFLTVNEGFVSIWELPAPGDGDPDRAVSWSQVISGTMLDEMGGVLSLDAPDWHQSHKRLEELGGPPATPSQRDDQLRTWYRQQMLASHRRQAAEFEYRRQWFVVTWYLDRLIAQSPSDGSLLVRRGRAYAELGRLEEALADCEAALRHEPDPYDRGGLALLCNSLALVLVSRPVPSQDPTRALVLARKAVQLEPNNAMYRDTLRDTLGVAQYRAGLYAEAIPTVEKLDPFQAEARALLDALLGNTPAELPADVFAPGPPGRP
jgi:hypothetical protein